MASTCRIIPEMAICAPAGTSRMMSSAPSVEKSIVKALAPMLDTMSVPNGKAVPVVCVDTEPSRTVESTDASAADITQLSFSASLSYTPS